MAKEKERSLIKRLKKGNEKAYIELIENYGNRLLKTCYLILRDEGDAEDVVQETLIKVFKNIDNFKGKSSLYTWIYRIGINLCRDKMKVRIGLEIYENIDISKDNIEEIVIKSIDMEDLRNRLINLNPIYREVLVLFYFEDFSIKEISSILEEKEGTIKSRLSRGRNLLKKEMEGEGCFENR